MNHPSTALAENGLRPRRAPARAVVRRAAGTAAADAADASAPSLLPDLRVWRGLFGGDTPAPAELAALGAITRARQLPAGSLVFSRGEPARGLLALAEGEVMLGQRPSTDPAAVFQTERHLQGPAWLDLSAAWLGIAYEQDARTMNRVVLLELPCEAVLGAAAGQPGLTRHLMRALAREARTLAASTHDLMHKDAPARLAAWLDQHCSDDSGSLAVRLSMRKRDIASLLAITPETLSRLMRSFSHQGVIRVAGYTVHVLDRPRLVQLAAGA